MTCFSLKMIAPLPHARGKGGMYSTVVLLLLWAAMLYLRPTKTHALGRRFHSLVSVAHFLNRRRSEKERVKLQPQMLEERWGNKHSISHMLLANWVWETHAQTTPLRSSPPVGFDRSTPIRRSITSRWRGVTVSTYRLPRCGLS